MGPLRPVVAAVGTTHPYAVTGLLVELTALRACGVRPVAVVAGVSAQSAASVTACDAVSATTIGAQFAALVDAGIAACSVGALLDPASVDAVAAGLRALHVPVVCDPVIAASGGERLADDATVAAYRDVLLPACTLVTPNIGEAARLIGRSLRSLADVRAAVAPLLALGARAVLITGGHLDGDPVDVFADASRVREFRAPRIAGELRGTGSLLSAAIAARLAHGDELVDAVDAGRTFVRERFAGAHVFAGMRVPY